MASNPADKLPQPPPAGSPVVPVAVSARRAAAMFDLSLRTWRRLDSAGDCPTGQRLGGRKLWLVSVLEAWANAGFPDRRTFEKGGAR